MGVTAEQRRAICRVYVPGAKDRWGTGFLVAPDLVMTAAHVVQKGDARMEPYDQSDVELRFGEPEEVVKVSGASVVKDRFRPNDDWALISLPAPISATPFKLRRFAPGYRVPWSTHGFPVSDNVRGLGYEGTVVTSANPRRLQLRSSVVEDVPAGVSGAPCIVDNHVAAMIVRTRSETSAETLYAVCMSVIARGCDLVETVSRPPYLNDVVFRLGTRVIPLLETAAEPLGVSLQVGDDRKPLVIADALMRRGIIMDMEAVIAAIVELVQGLDQAYAVDIVNFAARAWIDAAAIERLHEKLKQGSVLTILNTENPQIGHWYVHRAGCLRNNHVGIFRYCAAVAPESLVDAGSLRQSVDAALASLSRERPFHLGAFLADPSRGLQPAVLIVPDVPPRQVFEDMRAIEPRLDSVRFVLLGGPTIAPKTIADYGDAEIIKPELDSTQADFAVRREEFATIRIREQY